MKSGEIAAPVLGRRSIACMGFLIAVVVLSLLCALVLRRWPAVLVPAFLVPLYYVGLKSGWWGNGVGDGWGTAAVVVTAAALVATAGVVAVARLVGR